MDWLSEHLGSMGYAGDFYIPESGGGGGDGNSKNKRPAGQEQIRKPDDFNEPIKKENTESGFPRTQRFFTWEQFLSYVDWRGKKDRRSSQRTDVGYYQRSLTSNFQEAMNLAKYGWPDGLRRVKDIDKKIIFTPQEQMGLHYEQTSEYDVAGGSVNIGRYLMGMPDCMRHVKAPVEHVFPSRTQKIIVIDDTHSTTQTDEIINHGYMVYQIIEALESANIRTELILTHSANKQHIATLDDFDFFETYIKLKSPEDIIYPEKIIFALAHPSMLRRLVFSSWEKEPYSIRIHWGFRDQTHYGLYIPEWTPPQSLTEDALIIPGYDHKKEQDNVINQVNRMIQSQYDKARQ